MIVSLRATLSAHENGKPLDIRNETMLKKLLTDSGISGSDIYVTNVVKCAGPTKPIRVFTANAKICIDAYLDKEDELVDPSFWLYFGVSSIHLHNGEGIKITSVFPSPNNLYVTHSFEELYRHGIKYYNHALACLKDIKEKM